MKIDQIDIVRPANDLESYIMKIYEDSFRYVVLDKNGQEQTVQFTPKRLEEFLPSRTVSETLLNWENGIKERIKHYEDCIKTEEHPYWTKTQYYYVIVKDHTFPVERSIEIPQKMNKGQIKFFQSEVEKLKNIDGKMSFVKIVPFDFVENKLCNIYSEKGMAHNLNSVKINSVTDKNIKVEAIETGFGYEERTGRIYTMKKSDVLNITYL